ncbi:hypothetical protein Tco_0720942 [Tanacetum coccineum]
MASMKYCDKHNQVGFLKKPEESTGFAEIVDFLKGSKIRYALTHNPTIHDSLVKQFWQTATATTLADGTLELRATIDTLEYTITEASVRSKLQLADASGISMLPNNEIFEGMGNMGYPTDVVAVDHSAGQADQAVTQPLPFEPLPSSSPPPMISATTESEPTPIAESTTHPNSLSPRQKTEIPQSQDPTHPYVAEERTMTVDDLLQLVPKFIKRVDSLESIVKDKSKDFETPTQGKTSGEADISPEGLEAAETLAKVLTRRTKTYTRKVKTRLRRKLDVDEVNTGKGINTGFTDVNTAFEEIKEVNTGGLGVNSGSGPVSSARGQREGKALMIHFSVLKKEVLKRLKKEFLRSYLAVDNFVPIKYEAHKGTVGVCRKLETNRPEDAYDRVLWSDLRTIVNVAVSSVVEEIVHAAVKCGHDFYHGLDSANIQFRINSKIMLTTSQEAHNEDIQRNLKFTSEDQVRGGLMIFFLLMVVLQSSCLLKIFLKFLMAMAYSSSSLSEVELSSSLDSFLAFKAIDLLCSLLFLTSKEEHEVHLKLVLELLKKEKLFAKFSKCEFWLQEVHFLKHMVNNNGIHVDPSKIEALKNWKVPNTRSEIRSFLGLAGYCRRFIANFSKIAKPLTSLTQKNQKFKWAKKQEEAFQTLKDNLCNALILSLLDGVEDFGSLL